MVKSIYHICLWMLFLYGGSVLGQTATLSGRVTAGEARQPLPGVNIAIDGTNTGTSTDADGRYRINLPSGKTTIVFSYIGYITQRREVSGQTQLDVTLEEDNKSLNEVVVVGYGTVKKSDLTGSLAQVKAKELNAFPAGSVLQTLAGRAPGVQVIQNTGAPGASVSVRIRGTNSVIGSNEPLYVVDGFPLSGSNPIILNNSDIETMEILKDASATAIYGSRGANGVVIITTKSGKSGKMQVDYDGSYSLQTIRKKLDLMNATEYATFYNEQAANDGLKPYFTADQIAALGAGYDWQNLIYRQAPVQTHNLTVSGGTEKSRFSVGGSIFNQQGIVIGSNYKRYSLRANVTTDVSKLFSLSYGATLTNIQSSRQNNGGSNRGNSLMAAGISAAPVINPYNADGSLSDLRSPPYSFVGPIVNPLNYVTQLSDNLNSNRVLANLALTFKPFDGVAIRISGGVENTDERTDTYTSRLFPGSLGSAGVSTGQNRSLLSENTISYNKTLGAKHNIAAVAGFTYQDFLGTSLGGSGNGYLSDQFQTYNLSAASTPGIPTSGYSYATLLSYLGRVNYSFDNKYLVTASFRADGSSRYSDGNKWGYFPSGALAWRVSEEDFLKNNRTVSDLKVRTSWGLSGSQAISPYSTLQNLGTGFTVFNNALFNTFAPGTQLAGNLKWETTEQFDAGIDVGFLNNRFRLTADYYIKNTRDLLNVVSLPLGYGYTSTLANVGQIQNKGIEFDVSARVIDQAFKWDLSGNIAFNRNEVIKLQGGQDIYSPGINVTLISDNPSVLREGQPMNMFYGYQENGYTDKGQIVYKDLNGDGVINQSDKTIIGNPNPRYIFGLNSTMSYKGLELTMFWAGTQGNQLMNISAIGNSLDYGFGINMLRDVYLDHWTPTHTNAKYPIISRANSYRMSDRLVEDGSFVRLRNIQLAYTVPLQQLGVKWLRSAQVYASGQNLLTFTKYSWFDPEVNSQGGSNSTTQGIDWYTYPTAKGYTFGLRLGF